MMSCVEGWAEKLGPWGIFPDGGLINTICGGLEGDTGGNPRTGNNADRNSNPRRKNLVAEGFMACDFTDSVHSFEMNPPQLPNCARIHYGHRWGHRPASAEGPKPASGGLCVGKREGLHDSPIPRGRLRMKFEQLNIARLHARKSSPNRLPSQTKINTNSKRGRKCPAHTSDQF